MISNKNLYLDGELYTDEFPFEELNGLVRKKKKTSESEIEKINKIKLNVFDFFDLDRKDLTFNTRKSELDTLLTTQNLKCITLAPTYIADTINKVTQYHQQFVKEGYEGTILRNLNSVYQLNKRSKDLQKYKDFIDDEFLIYWFQRWCG